MSEIKRPFKVFLYHAPIDRARVRDLYLRLIHDGVDAWLVKDRLLPGQDWKHELQTSFREADVVVVCVSAQFERGEFLQKETRLALDAVVEGLGGETLIVPVRLEDCPLPASLERWQPVDLSEESGYDSLLEALRRRAQEIGATLQVRQSSLSHIPTPRLKDEQPRPEEKPVEVAPGALEVVEGAGILIEGGAVKQHKPARTIILALLGFGAIIMMAWLGPSWIENSQSLTVTPGVETTPTSNPSRVGTPTIMPEVIPIPTLTGRENISHIVFLIDTSGSMQGQRIDNVKSAASRFVSRLGEDYLVSVIEFDTNVELRMASTRDHTAAIQAIQSITVEVPHNGACMRDAFHAAIQQASPGWTTNDAEAIIILLTDVALGENLTWNCAIRFDEASPVPVFSIYLGEDFVENQFVASIWSTWGTGSVRPAITERKIESTLLEISEAAGLELNTELVFHAQTDTRQMSMVFVPPGDFIMGNTTVHLDSFWIDKTEVTNAMYARCVRAGVCSAPRSERSNTRARYYGNPEFDDYPMIYVSWEDAKQYCAWAGGRLPTEAEWEKAARGPDGRQFPWGNDEPAGIFGLLNYQSQDTMAVGSYPDGASPYGALDMAGNVSEWVADWLSMDYYSNPPTSNPSGPDSGEYRVWRGGSWANTSTERIRTSSRTGNFPTDSSSGIGFRCARDVGP